MAGYHKHIKQYCILYAFPVVFAMIKPVNVQGIVKRFIYHKGWIRQSKLMAESLVVIDPVTAKLD